MIISDVDLQNTVLDLFGQRGLKAGEKWPLPQFESAWDATTLRRHDLLIGLSSLCANDMLVMAEESDVTHMSLTTAGEKRVSELRRADPNGWNRYLRELLLPGLRTARRAGADRRSYEAQANLEYPVLVD